MPARKRSRTHLLSQLRRAPGPFRCVGAEKAQDPQEVHRRLQKMLGPPNMARRHFFTVSKLALAAAVVAALVEIALPPELPAPTKAVPPQVDLDLENAAFYQKTGALEYSQDQINATPISLID